MRESEHLSPVEVIRDLRDWYASPAGEHLYKELQGSLSGVLPGLFGYYAVQVGALSKEIDLLQSSRIGRKIYMTEEPCQGTVSASPLALPFQHDSLDLMVLLHTLDFSPDPHQVLREAHRVLISEGHLVVIAFNPISMMGLGKLALLRSRRVPWSGHFYTARRLRDWFSLLDLVIMETRYIGMRPPVRNQRVQQRLGFLGRASHYGLARLGIVQIFVVKKRVLTLTPRAQPWRAPKPVLPVNIAEPSAREANHARAGRYLH
ncbi:MAG: methyltransferase domain-containing protein [Gammaproteobacteria bacterium]|nr:methyltransferase domain-containing protein [Gammaproteobacteria bacterium]